MNYYVNGRRVFWKDPAGETSGIYKVLDTYQYNYEDMEESDIEQIDDRIVLIGNGSSEAEVYINEISPVDCKVVFRKFKNGEIIALFPEEPWCDRLTSSYMHMGQHGGVDYKYVISRTVPAIEAEYENLLKELKNIGYLNLRVMKKARPLF